jgi:hypothetical protein
MASESGSSYFGGLWMSRTISAGSTNATNVKSSAGQIYALSVNNQMQRSVPKALQQSQRAHGWHGHSIKNDCYSAEPACLTQMG